MKLSKTFFGFIIAIITVSSANLLLPNSFINTCIADCDTSEARQTFILATLKHYSPTGYYIVDTVNTVPAPQGMTWNKYNIAAYTDHTKETEIIGDLSTVVHETNHVYTARMSYTMIKRQDWDEMLGYAYYTGTETIPMHAIKVFPAREIASLIPELLRDSRYKLYVDNPNNLGVLNKTAFLAYSMNSTAITKGRKPPMTCCRGLMGLINLIGPPLRFIFAWFMMIIWLTGSLNYTCSVISFMPNKTIRISIKK